MDKTVYFKCEVCGKEILNMEDYNKETKDVSYGFDWSVEHKKEYCNKNE